MALLPQIEAVLAERGPLTGAELREATGADGFGLWKQCMLSERISVERVGRRYLRLDVKVEGYARLSPSILREFLTYTVVGPVGDREGVRARTSALATHIAEVSAGKEKLATRIVCEVGGKVRVGDSGPEDRFCVLLCGDIVYGMGHDAPRSERSTGMMVRGSDLDLVVITRDDAPPELARHLDESIYQEKYRHLKNPAFKEEIDYVVKPLQRVREQVAFDTFKHMLSCKILREARLVYGSEELYEMALRLLEERRVPEELDRLEEVAIEQRERAEKRLLEIDDRALVGDELYLFHTSEESEEFD